MSIMNMLTKWNPFRKSELDEWGSMTPWNPLQEMDRLQREIERAFNGRLGTLSTSKEAMKLPSWAPSVDIAEDDKEYTVKAELPEVKKEDVKVIVEDSTLTLRGERKAEKEEKDKKYHRIERSYGSFERRFTLPEDSDAGKITSEFKEGMLTVHLPKNPVAKPKTTEIRIQ